MGGRGASSGNISKNNIDKEMDKLTTKMIELDRDYRMSFSHTNPLGDSKIQQQWLKAQAQFNKLREKKQIMLDKEASARRKKDKDNRQEAFVNSYGEATKREITTSTYKRAMKRQNKNVLRNMGY